MRAYINRSPVQGPWGGGNLWVSAAHNMLPSFGLQPVGLESEPDIIFIAGLGAEGSHVSAVDAIRYKTFRLHHGKNVKIVLRVNENDARKGTRGVDSAIKEISSHIDHVVFVSEWLRDYFDAKSWKTPSSVIYNGVDYETFFPGDKLGNQKTNIVTHHWSDNVMKGFDVYDAIDAWLSSNPEFTFTYIGRDRGTFKNSRVIKPLFGKQLGAELSKYDVYVSGSRFDPGPNHIIESLACGLPTYVHIDGGGCVEFAGSSHAYKSAGDLLNIIAAKNYSMNNAWSPKNWSHCIQQFAGLARQ